MAMARRALAFLAACCLASRALGSAEEGTCASEGCKPQEAALGKENLLMQAQAAEVKKMKARASQAPPLQAALLQADAGIARVLAKQRADPAAIGVTVQKGLQAVMEAVKHFMKKPPDIQKGLDALGRKLLEAMHEPVKAEFNDPAAFAEFEKEWMGFFHTVDTTVPTIQGNITVFQEEGKPDAIILAITDILSVLSDGVARFLPVATAMEVVKYVDAVSDLLGAIGTSWGGFDSGQEAKAIEELYFALRSVLNQVLPEDLQNDATYKTVIGTLDAVMGQLSTTVLEFQKQIVEGSVCWKEQIGRKKERPKVCPKDFYWNGEQFCLPSPTKDKEPSLLETATSKKDEKKVDSAAGGKVPIPEGAMVALCDEKSSFSEKIGHWCYATCPQFMASTGVQCKTACGGAFPADDGGMMCGHNQGVLIETKMNMVISVTTGAINAGLQIAGMVEHGVDTDALAGTIDAFVAMGKPFAYSTCAKAPGFGGETVMY